MSNILIDLKENFELKFNARFSNRPNDQYGADGIAFVLHKDPRGLHATGQDGKGIGAQGIQKGLAVEFDTFWNRDNNGVSQEGDPSVSDPSPGDHTSVWDTDDPITTNMTLYRQRFSDSYVL